MYEGDEVLEVRSVTNLRTKETQKNDEPPPPKDKKGKGKKDKEGGKKVPGPDRNVTGTVTKMTEAPKGEIDGAVLDDGTVLHWPPHLSEKFAAVVTKGDKVRAVGFDVETPKGAKVLEVRKVTNLKTDKSQANDDAPPPVPGGRSKGGESKAVSGRVKRMIEAPKGEIDGAELTDGTLLHWPPHLEKLFTAVVKKGDPIEAIGRWEERPKGEKVLEVSSVTNLKTEETARNDGQPPDKDKKGKDKRGKDE